jgi:two-component system, OmpR family, sensor histidine kinase MprB
MTLRARLALLTSAAVALAIIAASAAAWLLIRAALLDEVDQRLLERRPAADQIARMTAELPESPDGVPRSPRIALESEPIGGQLPGPEGEVTRQIEPGDVDLPVDELERQLFAGDRQGERLRTVTLNGANYRVLSTPVAGGDVLRLIQPLEGVEGTMARIAWLLAAVAAGGVAMAGGLGWTTARAGLRPVDGLVRDAEQVARTKDLAHRIQADEGSSDEVARLAGAVNAMLAALDSARVQQRELVENAGHELRTPLATLRNDLGLLLRAERDPGRGLTDDERARLLHDLETEGAALSDLVGEVLDLARGDTEPESLLETSLRALVDRAVARCRRLDPAVEVVVHGPSLEAVVRPTSVERAVANLVRNAVQFSPAGEPVEVRLHEVDDCAVVEVLDRGPGLDPDELPRIFDRFYRGAGARERHGSGLGLAIVTQVADLHGGSITADNRPGGGASFTLRLPLQPPASPPS